MAKIVPMEHVIDVALSYIVKRQIQGRPTTLRQVSKRVGLGVSTVKGQFEKYAVQYVLIPFEEDNWTSSAIEVAVSSMPEKLAERNRFTVQQVEESYKNFMGDIELWPLEEGEEGEWEDRELGAITNMDPYYPYRIDTQQFQALKHELITFPELIEEGKKRGYSGAAIIRSVGGHKMVYALPGPLWRPYVYRNKRYYLKEVLNHLNQSYITYRSAVTAGKKRHRRLQSFRVPPIIGYPELADNPQP